jgi:cell division transport system permease protein
MSRVFFFIGEGLRALRRSTAPSIAAITTVAVTVVLLGILIPVLQATSSKTDEVRDQVSLRVFLFDDGTEDEVQALQTRIEGIPHVKSVEYVDKDEALQKLKGYFDGEDSDPTAVLPQGRNPLPRSFEIQPDDLDNLESIAGALAPPDSSGDPQPVSPIIEEVRDSREDATPIREVTGFVKVFLIVLASVLVIASLLLVGNTIRLSIYARRREVEVMQLVGATNWFIRWPFMVEGLICGFIGALAAVALLFMGKVTILDPLSDSVNLIAASQTMQFLPLALLLLAVAMGVSALGSGFTLRRFLKV